MFAPRPTRDALPRPRAHRTPTQDILHPESVLSPDSIINPRRACAARVTVLGLCVCLSVCLLPNISLFTGLFVPQTILTFSAADEGRKF